jgi:phosphate transport system substrate-binding protein
MAARRRRTAIALLATTLSIGLIAAGCGDDDSGSSTSGGGDLSGTIAVDGSSTVAPLTSAAAEAFNAENSGVDITVGTSGTGGGFEVFCKGETDISDASREIAEDEAKACADAGIEYEEIRVASDGITNVTKAGAAIGGERNLTLAQLKAIWEADSSVKNWSQIPGGNFNDVPLTLAGPGSQSGTYDFFNEEVLGEDAQGEVLSPRQDYAASEDDNNTITAIQSAEGGLGYFGFSYYEENQDELEAFAVDGVEPTSETITDGTYPLSRPLFIYVSKTALQEKPHVRAFVNFYVENAVSLAEEQRFVPAPQESIDADKEKLAAYE